MAWAEQNGQVVSLSEIHRTDALGLLKATSELRNGLSITTKGKGFRVLGAFNHNVGASFVAKSLNWWGFGGDIAIITPVRAETSLFVRNLLRRIEEKPIGTPSVGPYKVPWELAQEDAWGKFFYALKLPDDPNIHVSANEIVMPNNIGATIQLKRWLDQQRRLLGKTTFTVSEIQKATQRIFQNLRIHRRIREGGVRTMTIHQAKNREFESVIVLWPYEVGGSPERQRRLLYNALTRAKRQALVIVQDPKRINAIPFVT